MAESFEALMSERLAGATACCAECGQRYGRSATKYSSMWEGYCDVCGAITGVADTRDWGYLMKGRAEFMVKNNKSRLTDSNR